MAKHNNKAVKTVIIGQCTQLMCKLIHVTDEWIQIIVQNYFVYQVIVMCLAVLIMLKNIIQVEYCYNTVQLYDSFS